MNALYPNFKEWQGLQGGEPVLFANEEATLFKVAHIYPSEGEVLPTFDVERARKIGHYGCLIDTPAIQMNKSVREPMELIVGDTLKPITLPAVLYIERHGRPCAQRSGKGTDPGYQHIGSSKDWTEWLLNKADNDWDLWRINQQDSGKLQLVVISSLKKLFNTTK